MMKTIAKKPSSDHAPQKKHEVTYAALRNPHSISLAPQRPIVPLKSLHPFGAGVIQPKLAISQPGDVYEQEADRVAEQVMRMPAPTLQRSCAPCAAGGAPCPKCAGEKKELVQRSTGNSKPETGNASASVPDNFLHSLGSGQPLDASTRAFMEPRFGHDFGHVRVHTDARAAESARSVSALAYTVGRDVVFGARQYTPGTSGGQRLLAHELTHVVQQSGSDSTHVGEKRSLPPTSLSGVPDAPSELPTNASSDAHEQEVARTISKNGARVQRVCGPSAIGNPAGCEPFGSVATEQIFSVPTERFLFTVNCNDFISPAERARLRVLAPGIAAADPVDIHGFASEEGDATYNARLSCSRAMRVRDDLVDARTRAGLPPLNIRGIFNHGATAFGTRDVNRSVVIPLAQPPTVDILGAGFIGPPAANQRRAAASCPIDCDGRTLGTMHAMGLFFHRSRGPILPNGDPTANGIGTSLHFTETAIDIPDTSLCHCDDYRIIQVLTTTHPAAGRVSPYVDNNGVATPFYDAVFLSGEGIHVIPAGYPDSGERTQSTISIYDRPFRGTAGRVGENIRWEAEACVTCIKNRDPDRVLGCATYGFSTTWNVNAGAHDPVAGIGPGCLAVPSATFLTALRTDPTVVDYDFEGR